MIVCAAIIVLVISLFMVVSDIKIYRQKQKLNSEISDLQQKIKNLQDNNNNLKQNISQADNPQYMEKIAREEFGEQLPGEKAVNFVVTQDKTQPKNGSVTNSINNLWSGWIGGVWAGIKNFLGLK